MIDPYLPPPGRAVDVGCGHGAIVHALLERGWDARGFDMSEWMIDAARKHAPQLGADRFVVGDVNAFPFDGAFELVTCFEVLEHIPDPLPALGALRDHLAPGGRLIATTPNLEPLMPAKDPLTSDPTHVSVHSPRWWRARGGAAPACAWSASRRSRPSRCCGACTRRSDAGGSSGAGPARAR